MSGVSTGSGARVGVAMGSEGAPVRTVDSATGLPPDGPPHTASSQATSDALLDFGPQSVDGWLAGLVAAELGVAAWDLDADAHELRHDGQRIGLTPLEFQVLDRLRRIPGRTVSRRELLEGVWGWDGAATSNVVETTVRRLRQKLDGGPIVVETVRGAGYRLQDR